MLFKATKWMGPWVLPHRQEQERHIPAGSSDSVATRASVCVPTALPMPLGFYGHCTPVSKVHLSTPLAQAIMVRLSTRGPAFSSHDCNSDCQEGESTLGWCCQGACASSQRAFRKCWGEGAGVGKSQWLEQRLKAFGGRAWHANHPVLGQACTMRNFPTGYSSRSKSHIYNFQTYKLISTLT